MTKLTHLDAAGQATMVDVSGKAVSSRTASAHGAITMSSAARVAIRTAALAKGDALAIARIAGIMAAKQAASLIPLCHNIQLSSAEVAFAETAQGFSCTATVKSVGATGVEMEALTAVSIALLTLYDMAKAIDKSMTIMDIHVTEKTK